MRAKEINALTQNQVPYELIALQAKYAMLDPKIREERLRYCDDYGMEHVEAVMGHVAIEANGHVICSVDHIDYNLLRLLSKKFKPALLTLENLDHFPEILGRRAKPQVNRMHAIVGCHPDPRGAGVAIYFWEESEPSIGCHLYITHPKILLDMPILARNFAGIWLTAIDKHVIKG